MKRSIPNATSAIVPAQAPPSTPAPPPLLDDGSLGYLVKLTYATMRRGMDASLREAGLTVPQWRALGILHHKPGATHSELVRHLEIEAPSVTSLVNGMQRKGWIRQERSSTDARAKRLYLTAAGKKVLGMARSACSPVQSRMEEILPPAQRAELKRLLRAVVDGMR